MNKKFVKVKCNKCNNEQIIFRSVSSYVSCLVCGESLADPTGGRSDIKATALEEI